MPIAIFIDKVDAIPAVQLMDLHKVLKCSLGELRQLLASGEPIVAREIFDNDFDQHAALIRNVLLVIEDGNLEHRIYELPEGRGIKTCDASPQCLIGVEVLRNILNEADAELNRQLDE